LLKCEVSKYKQVFLINEANALTKKIILNTRKKNNKLHKSTKT